MQSGQARLPDGAVQNGRARVLAVLSTVVFALCLLAEAIYCYKRPMTSLDSLAYVAITEQSGPEAFGAVRDRCVALLAGQPISCDSMKAPSLVDRVAAYSPQDFQSFLLFYRVKPLFSLVLNTLHRSVGVEAYKALGLISSVSFACIAIVLWFWLREHLSTPAASLMALLIVSYSTVLDLGKFLLPDAFSAALLLLALYLVLYRKAPWLGGCLLFLLPLARPDNLIFVFFFLALMIARSSQERQRKLLWFAALVVACVVYNTVAGRATHTLPYPVLFVHSFSAWSDPADFAAAHLTLRFYLHALIVYGTKTLLIDLPLPLLLAVLATANTRGWRVLRETVAAACTAVAIRILLFPAMELRYYTWLYLLGATAVTIFAAQAMGNDSSWFRRRRSVSAADGWPADAPTEETAPAAP